MSPAPNPLSVRQWDLWCLGQPLGFRCRVRVLLIGAFPIAGVRPLLARDGVSLSALGVGLFGNAAQSGW